MATGKITIASLAKLEGWLWDTSVIGLGARKQTRGVFYYLRYRHNGAQIMKSIGLCAAVTDEACNSLS